MLWKKTATPASNTPSVVPIDGDRQDFLEELARQSGEGKDRVQSLLEDYARQRDRGSEPRSATALSERPAPTERRWSTVAKSTSVYTPTPVAPPSLSVVAPATAPVRESAVADLTARLSVVEEGMSHLIDTVKDLRRQLSEVKPSNRREANTRILENLAQLVESVRQANG